MLRKRLFLTALGVACLAAALAMNLLGRGAARPSPAPSRAHAASAPGSRLLPSAALTGALEAAARGETAVLPAFFSEPESVRDQFAQQWLRRLPDGTALVENADQFDAGAENGWPVNVTVWISDGKRVACLTGEVEFRPAQSGFVIDRINLRGVPLMIGNWSQAISLIKAQDVRPTGSPFYGVFRVQAGGVQYAIDARTGNVEAE